MRIRNTEGEHPFSSRLDAECNIGSMQGLLMDDHGHFTAAVEAFELEQGEQIERIVGPVFSSDALFIKSCFAEEVGVPFFLLQHRDGTNGIVIHQIVPDRTNRVPKCLKRQSVHVERFAAWWRERKRTIQTKPYRADFQSRVRQSYFDWLLESHGEKWGGNIDGYFFSPYDGTILGAIEKRFTNKAPLARYDPAKYFRYNGGDYYTWYSLFLLRDLLNVPLFLFTFSNIEGEQEQVGITIVDTLDHDGISYIRDEKGKEIPPNALLCTGVDEAKERMRALYELYLETKG